MLNPFFLQGSKGEQNLVQDLINEQLKMYGVDVHYIPREYITEKTVIKEVIESRFRDAFPIEAYVDSYEGYGGQGTILSKFGVQELDDLNLIISKERFETYISPLLRINPNTRLSTRPKEGDLIYFPLGDRLFEIKYVEHEKPFYQLQKNYVYELRCELFRYGDEIIDTEIDEIDDNVEKEGYTQTIQLVGLGTTASAVTGLVNGGVRLVKVLNRGSGYKSAPNVQFGSAPGNGITATGVAKMISGIVDFCESDPNLYRVQSVSITNPGRNYTSAPKVVFKGGGGAGAAATCFIGDGIVGIVTVTNGGSGYAKAPSVTFVGVCSSPAYGTALIQNGSVIGIAITDAGLNYTSAPQIIFESPVLTGDGSYLINETVTGSVSGVSAKVREWNYPSKSLKLYAIEGSFVVGETLTGSESGAYYTVQSINTNNVNDTFAENEEIEIESDSILDFSENNPFGNP
jgi:hypothetical protein